MNALHLSAQLLEDFLAGSGFIQFVVPKVVPESRQSYVSQSSAQSSILLTRVALTR
jgi:hypothetical protein|eukprot:COSAG01_NODE_2486_length_7593_cov_2.425674_6_plen_56_part_00